MPCHHFFTKAVYISIFDLAKFILQGDVNKTVALGFEGIRKCFIFAGDAFKGDF